MRNIFKGKCKCLIGTFVLNKVFVFIPASMEKDELDIRHEAINIAEYVYNLLAEKAGADIFIGIGTVYNLHDLNKSYEESLKAVNCMTESGVMHIKDAPVKNDSQLEYPHAKEKLLLYKAASGDTQECIQAFNQICDCLFKEYVSSFHIIKKKLLELMILIRRLGCNYKIEDEEYFIKGDYIEEFLRIEDPNELKACCRKRIEYVAQNIKKFVEGCNTPSTFSC